jgi:hypothetical protein
MKKPEFASGDAVGWMEWRQRFLICVVVNNWDDLRARRECFSAMSGKAHSYVQDIDRGEVAPVQPVGQLLDLYEQRFLPRSAGEMARGQFRRARQDEDEEVLAWHARLRTLYKRANPGLNEAQIEIAAELRETFLLGLATSSIRKEAWKLYPVNYADCLRITSNLVSADAVLDDYDGAIIKPEPKTTPAMVIKQERNVLAIGDDNGLAALNRRAGGRGRGGGGGGGGGGQRGSSDGCHCCGDFQHYIRNCPIKAYFQQRGLKPPMAGALAGAPPRGGAPARAPAIGGLSPLC